MKELFSKELEQEGKGRQIESFRGKGEGGEGLGGRGKRSSSNSHCCFPHCHGNSKYK